jgi:hypothetical protein
VRRFGVRQFDTFFDPRKGVSGPEVKKVLSHWRTALFPGLQARQIRPPVEMRCCVSLTGFLEE